MKMHKSMLMKRNRCLEKMISLGQQPRKTIRRRNWKVMVTSWQRIWKKIKKMRAMVVTLLKKDARVEKKIVLSLRMRIKSH